MTKTTALAMVVMAWVTASSWAAVTYTTPTNINLLRHVNENSQIDTQIQWANLNNGGTVGYSAYYAMDSGYWQSQVNYNNLSNPTNTGSLQIALATPQYISTLVQTVVDIPTQYQVWGSNTGFGSMTNLTLGWQPGAASITTTVNTSYQYLQLDYLGTSANYMRVTEVVAKPSPSASIRLNDGYNLLAYRPAEGGPSTIPIANALYQSGWRVGSDSNYIVDLNIGSMLVQENLGANINGPNYFVLPLNGLYKLGAFATGAWHGQSWTGITVEYTTDPTISAGTVWNLAYTQGTAINSATIPFASPITASFVRVSAPTLTTTANGAMSSFELFAWVPEPASLSLLALGGLALLRGRRKLGRLHF